MKKTLKSIYVLICTAFMFALFCGCEHYEERDIVQWACENIGTPIYVSSEYTERPSFSDENYTDRVWTAYLEEMPELEFEIISHEYWGLESISHSIETTYGYVYGKYYFDLYCAENQTDFTAVYTEPNTYNYQLQACFSDRADLSDIIDQAEDIADYMLERGMDAHVNFHISYDDVLSSVDDTNVTVFAYCDSFFDEVEAEAISEYAQYAADYRLALDEFTTEELTDAAEGFGSQFNITRADDTVVSYSDLSLSRFGYGMSFGCMYEVFSREGFEVSGTPEHFTFAGIDGSTYEFSYSFNDYLYEDDKVGYYYIKDGVKTPMDYYFYNHFRTHFIKEISGLSFEELKIEN